MSAVTVFGYAQRCDSCGVMHLLAEDTPGWICPNCTDDPEDQLLERAYTVVKEFLEALRQLRPDLTDPALLDTVDTLNDEDPGPVPLAPEEG